MLGFKVFFVLFWLANMLYRKTILFSFGLGPGPARLGRAGHALQGPMKDGRSVMECLPENALTSHTSNFYGNLLGVVCCDSDGSRPPALAPARPGARPLQSKQRLVNSNNFRNLV